MYTSASINVLEISVCDKVKENMLTSVCVREKERERERERDDCICAYIIDFFVSFRFVPRCMCI